ncbi:ATP-binding protein [Synergistaceae bacterium OttesenSCG-928-I11]|nr:ATP-binding protein [Synergistaceae bacterium OttesenSCG-928-I11]
MSASYDIIEEAEHYSFGGDIWASYFALRLAEDENQLGLCCELGAEPRGSIMEIASKTLWDVRKILIETRVMIETDPAFHNLSHTLDYTPSNTRPLPLHADTRFDLSRLGKKIVDASKPEEIGAALAGFYRTHGSGAFALHCAFRWDGTKGLLPVTDLDPIRLDSLIGYDTQKRELLSNTEYFIGGAAANNVLLFGDSGTGKSSSVRALLNEPGYVGRGLRMIELYKDQFRDIPQILGAIRKRNYRFILFMDDLSFEEFEIEYKYLKAVIEGGLERKPENTVIYATSNRRNLIREVWADRKAASDDVHGSDTMQEKLSLSDRFGVTIWYGPAAKSEYIDIVKSMAAECGIEISEDELERRALRWEIEKGSFTGRTARQFVQNLLVEFVKDSH